MTYTALLARLATYASTQTPHTPFALRFDRQADFIKVATELNKLYPFYNADRVADVHPYYLRIGKRGSGGNIIGIRSPEDCNPYTRPYSMYQHITYSPLGRVFSSLKG